MDPNNPVNKLCIEGLKSQSQGNHDEALAHFTKAWEIRKDDLDACVAAHFLAKEQKTLKESLRWNKRSLQYAKKLTNQFVQDFYPSLYINIADNLEKLGELKQAKIYYDLAAESVTDTSLGSHGILLLDSIKKGQKRTS